MAFILKGKMVIGPRPESIFNRFSFGFDGTDEKFDTSSINLGLENTISFWAKSDGTNFNGMVLGGIVQSNYYTVFLTSTNRLLYRVGGGANSFDDADIISALGSGNWFHCALVRNNGGTDVLCYINGDLKQTVSGIVGSGNNTIVQDIGARTLNDFYIRGTLDEIAVWSSALSNSDIISIYNLGKPNDLSSLSPISWWRGDEANFTGGVWTLTDQGSGGNDGTSSAMDENNRVEDTPQ